MVQTCVWLNSAQDFKSTAINWLITVAGCSLHVIFLRRQLFFWNVRISLWMQILRNNCSEQQQQQQNNNNKTTTTTATINQTNQTLRVKSDLFLCLVPLKGDGLVQNNGFESKTMIWFWPRLKMVLVIFCNLKKTVLNNSAEFYLIVELSLLDGCNIPGYKSQFCILRFVLSF